MDGGSTVKVRPKDVSLLHPGPLRNLKELDLLPAGDFTTAWELLDGQVVPLRELAELAFGAYTPASAWAAWQQVMDGLYFRGTPEAIRAIPAAEVARYQAARQALVLEEQAWSGFAGRAAAGTFAAEDQRYLREVEDLALKRREGSRVLRELKRSETPEAAHAFLLELGYWAETYNPYPARLGVSMEPPQIRLPDMPEEERLDLTHLPAFAVDDQGSTDPDDAISLEMTPSGPRLWIHVADAAALAPPGSPADLEARARGANLYLPEATIPMLPEEATPRLGLGLQEVSPALSFGITLTSSAEVDDLIIKPSRIRVQRLTYEEVQDRLDEEPFANLYEISRRCLERRLRQGAVSIDLPEIKLRAVAGIVTIQPVLPLQSRSMVREAMLLAGEAAAIFSLRHNLPAPFATQAASDKILDETVEDRSEAAAPTITAMFALRRAQNRGQASIHPAQHSGVGLAAYVRATSPLRRYLDLVAHQQIRAWLSGSPTLSEQEMLERIGASEAVIGGIAQAESLSRRHWTLIFLLQNPSWRGEAVLVEKRGSRGRLIIPELAYETWVSLRGDTPLDTRLTLSFKGVNLPELEGFFRVE